MIPQFENNPGSWFPPLIGDTTSRVVARIIRDRPRVIVHGICKNGVVKFSLLYRPLKLTPAEIQNMAFLRYQVLVDFLGGFLMQTNIDSFLDLLVQCDFEHYVRKGPVSHFRIVSDDKQLTFVCTVNRLYYLLNETLAKMLEGEQASVALRWDFLRRDPKNRAH